ncbi:MAG: hypothetical protein IKR81_15780 [Victivallales bacterium]|nr:hypothetical protein [Victivallales bacterium]
MQSPSQAFLKRDDVRGLYPAQLNGKVAEALGQAVVERLIALGEASPCIAIGHDCRHGNTEIAQGLMLGILKAGGRYKDLGLVSTEHVYYACGQMADEFAAGAMVTASHNPKEYNGVKFIHRHCVPFGQEDLAYLGKRADELLTAPQATMDFAAYAKHLLALSGLDQRPDSDKPLFKVVVLAGNGMGGIAFAPLAALLERKGLQTIILEGEPNGDFPQGVPNPLLPDFMQRLSKFTVENGANLGIGFDGDADRAGFVDSTGTEIIPSQVLALIAQDVTTTSRRRDSIRRRDVVATPVIMRNLCCSQLLKKLFGDSPDVTLIDTPVGHGRIKQLMRSEKYRQATLFAGEHSGHYFYPEFSYVDSGVLTSLNMISLAWELRNQGGKLADVLSAWRKEYVWSGELNYNLPSKEAIFKVLCTAAKAFPGAQRYECRVDAECNAQRVFEAQGEYRPEELPAPDLKLVQDSGASGWWFVLRPSGNEPKLRLNVEAWGKNASADCQKIAGEVEAIILQLGGIRA